MIWLHSLVEDINFSIFTSLSVAYRNLIVASAKGKSFGFGAPDANEIIDGGLFAKMAAAQQNKTPTDKNNFGTKIYSNYMYFKDCMWIVL